MGTNASAVTREQARPAGDPPPRLVTRPLLIRFVSIVGSAASFYLLLSTVPEYARATGASAGTAGLTTTALTLSSVAAYLVAPRLIARYGYRPVLAAGLGALGGPALVLAAPAGLGANLAVIMTVCIVRGLGFAVVCVAGYALTVSLIPPQRRGEGLAVVGVVSGIPSVACLPLGVWLAAHVGYGPVFVAGGAAALIGLASVPWLPRPARTADRPAGILAALRTPDLARPAVTFSVVTMAVGIVVTFLPLAVTRTAADVAALALLVQPAAAIGGRWLAGRYGDRHGPARLLAPGVLLAAAGMLTLSLAAFDVRPVAGIVRQRGRRAVEPGLRRGHGGRRGRVRAARRAHRVSGGLRADRRATAGRARWDPDGGNTHHLPFRLKILITLCLQSLLIVTKVSSRGNSCRPQELIRVGRRAPEVRQGSGALCVTILVTQYRPVPVRTGTRYEP